MTAHTYSWVGDTLYDDRRHPIATVTGSQLTVGDTTYRITKTGGRDFRLRADGGGVTFIFTTTSLTTNRLEAMCGSWHYILRRPRPWNPTRTITTRDGTNYGTITRTFSPRSGATIKAELSSAGIPNAHLAFLAYGCKLVDTDTTNIKI
jgi:hypothetical protein